ncbi:MAG: RagB/SusD family nutrient uptake outer membrane protein [Bacteroidales bacterium]
MKKILYFLPFLLILFSCEEELEVKPKGVTTLSSAKDLRLLLDNINVYASNPRSITYGYDLIRYASDDVFVKSTDLSDFQNSMANAFAFYSRDTELIEKYNYGDADILYQVISLANVVVNKIGSFNDMTENDRKQIEGEGRVHRAFSYLILANIYGKHYNNETSGQDKCVPLIKTDNVNIEVPERASVKEAYDFILEDLLSSIDLLGKPDEFKYTPSIATAYALLSRVYLYMYDYENAEKYATKALEKNSYLENYEDKIDVLDEIKAYDGKALLLYKNSYWKYVTSSKGLKVNPELYSSYEDGDLRKLKFDDEDMRYSQYPTSFTGITVAEMYLTRAECKARANKLGDALDDLNTIRQNRYTSESYIDLDENNQQMVIDLVKLERRKELCFTGLRWFDMKRFNEPFIRMVGDKTLNYEVGSDLWVFPLPGDYY